MLYLITGIAELMIMLMLAAFHNGTFASVMGLFLLVFSILIPVIELLTMKRRGGRRAVKLFLTGSSAACLVLELLALVNVLNLPSVLQKLLFAYIGISAVVFYAEKKLHRSRRSVSKNSRTAAGK